MSTIHAMFLLAWILGAGLVLLFMHAASRGSGED